MEKQWFIQFDKHHKGPFADEDVMRLWREKKLNGESFFWKKGMPHWERMDHLETFKDFFPPNSIPKMKVEKIYDETDSPYDRPLPDIPRVSEIEKIERKEAKKSSHQQRKLKQKTTKKNSLWFPVVVLVMIVLSAQFYLHNRELQNPEGLSPEQFAVLSEVTKINPDNHIRFETYFDSEKNRLWLSSNIANSESMQISFSSLPGKVLSLGPINFKSATQLNDHFAKVETYEFAQGIQIYPGLYKVEIVYEYAGDQKLYSDVLYLGPGTEDDFSKNLQTYQAYVKQIFKSYQDELIEKYATLINVTKDLESRYQTMSRRLSKGSQVSTYQDYYVQKIGPMLTKITVDSFDRPLELKLDISAIKNYFSDFFELSKRLSVMNAGIIEDIRPLKNISREKRKELFNGHMANFRSLKEKLFFEQTKVKNLRPF